MSLHVFGRPDPDEDAALQARYAELMRDEASIAQQHPDEDAWVRLACGELDDAERDHLSSHVVRCAECATIYRGLAELRREAQALAPGSRPPAPRPHPPSAVRRTHLVRFALGAAAAIAVLAGGALFLLPLRERPSTQAVSPGAPATPPADTALPSPGPRAWALALAPPDVVLPVGIAIPMRGDDANAGDFLRAFGAAITPYREGHYASAVPLLRDLVAAHPQSREARFYLAASLLLDGHPQEAAPLLSGNGWPEALRDDAHWLHAVAVERSGDRRAADEALDALCRSAGPRQPDACAAAGKPTPPAR